MNAIMMGRFSFTAKARTASGPQWTPLNLTREFALAYPDFHWDISNKKVDTVQGVATFAPKAETLLVAAKRARTSDSYQKIGFYLPALSQRPGPPYTVPVSMFKLWDWFFVGMAVESRVVRPNMLLHGHVIAFNLSTSPQTHTLVPKEHPVPANQMAALTFNLPPGRWAANPIFLPVKPAPGDYALELRSTSTAAKVGKAAAITALTLGMFTYVPGHKGFKVPFGVLNAQDVKVLDDFEATALRGVERLFEKAAVDRAVLPGDRTIGKADLLTEFRKYIWFNPDRTFGILEQAGGPDLAGRQIFDRFVLHMYGASIKIGAASYPPPATA